MKVTSPTPFCHTLPFHLPTTVPKGLRNCLKKKNTKSNPIAAPELAEDNFSLAFRQKRGKLPWPVADGFIAKPYGRQRHPTIKNIEITKRVVDRAHEKGISVEAELGIEHRAVIAGQITDEAREELSVLGARGYALVDRVWQSTEFLTG